mgnify:CR=1 FL=1|tara:strand:+ start:375 stop:545 length:171 start_codon:yes stop_codon:yes gene_type:complete
MSIKDIRRKEPRKRNPVARELHKFNKRKVFRSQKSKLAAKDVDRELKDYMRGNDDG